LCSTRRRYTRCGASGRARQAGRTSFSSHPSGDDTYFQRTRSILSSPASIGWPDMETSLHRELKLLYADRHARVEVPVSGYRIDAIDGDWLVEIQHGSLSAIRDKVRKLLAAHQVLVVKPLVARKTLVRRRKKGGAVISRRTSPKRASLLSLFDELIYFTRVFPHPRLALHVVLVDVEEWRYPGHGRRRWRRQGDFIVEDQKLVAIGESMRLATTADLWRMMPANLPQPFHTGHLAEGLAVERWIAQRIAYCLRHTGTVREVGKERNARLYQRVDGTTAAA